MAERELSFHRKYRPSTLSGYIGNAKLKESLMKTLKNGNRPQVMLFYGDSGCGKAQPLDSLVLTTDGYKKMGEINIGDEVFTHKGNIGKVSGIYPQGVRPIYRIYLDDNTYIDVSDEHINLVWGSKRKSQYSDMSEVVDIVDSEPQVITTMSLVEQLKTCTYYIRRTNLSYFYAKFGSIYSTDMSYFNLYSEARILYIERIEDQECQCIMIDHPDHTYISDYFIPTHNTTIARLLAKEYLCTDRNEETGSCGVCYNCQAMDDYIHTGDTSNLASVREVDIASDSGKRDLDAVVEDMMIPSFEWKIYILDECHEASSGAQNRLLKIVEEPPENVLIIFCTTNPERMLDTLKNRCQIQLKVTKPSVKELAGLSKFICETEDVEFDTKGLEFIANRAECTIRTNLQYLQRVINEQGKVDYSSAIKVFEEVSNVTIIKFFKALKSNNILSYVTLLYKIKTTMDLNVFLKELQQFVKRGIYVINGINLDGISDGDLISYRELFSDLGIAKISFLLHKLLTLDTSNIEMELLVLGYSGLSSIISTDGDKSSGLELIESIDNECMKEQAQAVKVIKENEEIESQNGIKNADSLVEEANMDIIMQMGGILVED